jgi:hypothetical protein
MQARGSPVSLPDMRVDLRAAVITDFVAAAPLDLADDTDSRRRQRGTSDT